MIHLVGLCLLAGDNGIADYLCFRAVCARWRSSTACPRGRGLVDPRLHPRHWMMLPEGYGLHPGHAKLGGWVRFINLRTGSIARIHLPLFQEHCILDSVDGLLLLHRNHDMAVRIFHPFTGDTLDLPSLATIRPHRQRTARTNPRFKTVSAAAVSVRPDGVITAMLAFDPVSKKRIAFATSEDQQWTLSSWETEYRSSAMSFQGKLYFMVHRLPSSKVFMIDPSLIQKRIDSKGSSAASSSLQPPMLIATFPQKELNICGPLHLVERNSEIILVGRTITGPSEIHYQIYRLADIIIGRLSPLKCIGDSALFLSIDRSICVSSRTHPTIAGDSVISMKVSTGLVEYPLKTGTWSIATDGLISRSPIPIPSPYTLVHHIYTCCVRRFWNNGQIFHWGTYDPVG